MSLYTRQRRRRNAFSCPRRLASALLFLVSSHVTAQDDDEPTSSAAQASAPFVEPATGLGMERFFGARTQFGFAIALPEQPTDSFLGQLSFPLRAGAGWGALGLTGDSMQFHEIFLPLGTTLENEDECLISSRTLLFSNSLRVRQQLTPGIEVEGNFFLAVWPDGAGGVLASFRQGTNEDNPPEVQGSFRVRPIARGVQINETFLTYTFLCEGCLDATLGLGPQATAADAVMGWALSERAVRNPENPAVGLGFHERGFGPFTARLGNARTAQFDAVAALAGAPVGNSGRAVLATPNAFLDGGEDSGDEDGGEGGDDGGSDDDD